ncbi:MAG: LysR family transcriptional regulator [Synergistaceae bacterium]|nr:LysR family transcriptional regulator [Synergistaceae bacterium]
MTYEQIETFIAIMTYGNITSASNFLHVSQSTVSARIQLLENELGTPLFMRHKGHRTVELTTYGQAFVPMASQWASVFKDSRNLRTLANISTLSVASVDAVNNYTFVPLFNKHIESFPNIRLTIRTHHSDEIHGLISNRTADIGFVFSRSPYPDIISKPVYRELMYLICHKDSGYYDGMPCSELQPENEIYLHWGLDFQQWHNRFFPPERYPLVSVNTGSMLQHYLDVPGRWAVAPMSVVRAVSHRSSLTYYTLSEPPSPRICYMLTNRYPARRQKSAIETFISELEDFIELNDDICAFQEWMLNGKNLVS